jgi:hypothetical protein
MNRLRLYVASPADVIDGENIWVIQGSRGTGFLLERLQSIFIG